MFETLAALVQPWATIYADQPLLSTGIIALHVLAMFIGGGFAIGADRAILRSPAGSADAVRAVVADLVNTHMLVAIALAVSILSGLALFAADLAILAASPVYWLKMATLAALLLNGWRMRRAEQVVMRDLDGVSIHTTEMPVAFPQASWRAVRVSAQLSLALWIALVLLGVFLSNG